MVDFDIFQHSGNSRHGIEFSRDGNFAVKTLAKTYLVNAMVPHIASASSFSVNV